MAPGLYGPIVIGGGPFCGIGCGGGPQSIGEWCEGCGGGGTGGLLLLLFKLIPFPRLFGWFGIPCWYKSNYLSDFR